MDNKRYQYLVLVDKKYSRDSQVLSGHSTDDGNKKEWYDIEGDIALGTYEMPNAERAISYASNEYDIKSYLLKAYKLQKMNRLQEKDKS